MTPIVGIILSIALVAVICALVWSRPNRPDTYFLPFNLLPPTTSSTVLLFVIAVLAAAVIYKSS
jgi:hypothetical protein